MRRGRAADLVGTICPACDLAIHASEISVERRGYMHRAGRFGSHFVWFDRPASVQKSPGAGAVDRALATPRLSTNGRRSPARRGRPEVFIAALVVKHAAELYAKHRRWSDVLRELAASGNGRYPRNTLIRRVEKYAAGQNPRPGPRRRAAAGARPRVSKNPRAGRRRRRA